MLRILALVMLFSAALEATAARADARLDCQMLRGDAAIQACDLAISQFPADAEAYKNRGDSYLAKGDFDGVIDDYTKAIEINPKDADAYNNRGYAYETKDDFDRAAADFTKAIEVNPKDADAYINRCWLRATANRDLTLAFADCDTGLRLAPNDANGLDSLGFLYLRLGRLDEAIDDYNAALKTNPRLADSMYGRGLCKRKKGDQAGGNADIAAAKAIQADIAAEYAKYGMN
jgi:tetratricopeptide (TPR) repeat protein